jgi:predicted nucleic acid-binding protein
MGVLDGAARVFLDSSFLIALYGASDASHRRAVELLEEADTADSQLCTIWDCLGESLTILRRHFTHRAALALIDSIADLRFVA